MSAVRTRVATHPVICPHCKQVIDRGELICGITRGTTETSACYSCAFDDWDAQRDEVDGQ